MTAREHLMNTFAASPGAVEIARRFGWDAFVTAFTRWGESRACADPHFRALWGACRAEEDEALVQAGFRLSFWPSDRLVRLWRRGRYVFGGPCGGDLHPERSN
jgi:hypothetical protein